MCEISGYRRSGAFQTTLELANLFKTARMGVPDDWRPRALQSTLFPGPAAHVNVGQPVIETN